MAFRRAAVWGLISADAILIGAAFCRGFGRLNGSQSPDKTSLNELSRVFARRVELVLFCGGFEIAFFF